MTSTAMRTTCWALEATSVAVYDLLKGMRIAMAAALKMLSMAIETRTSIRVKPDVRSALDSRFFQI